jgi:hypothetical protein
MNTWHRNMVKCIHGHMNLLTDIHSHTQEYAHWHRYRHHTCVLPIYVCTCVCKACMVSQNATGWLNLVCVHTYMYMCAAYMCAQVCVRHVWYLKMPRADLTFYACIHTLTCVLRIYVRTCVCKACGISSHMYACMHTHIHAYIQVLCGHKGV